MSRSRPPRRRWGFASRRLDAESVALSSRRANRPAMWRGCRELVIEGLAGGRCAVAAGLGADRAAGRAGTSTGSSPRPGGTLWRCWIAAERIDPGGAGRAGVGFPVRGHRSRGGSRASFRRRVAGSSGPEPSASWTRSRLGYPTGDPGCVWRAAGLLGIGAEAAAPAADGRVWSSSAPGWHSVIR